MRIGQPLDYCSFVVVGHENRAIAQFSLHCNGERWRLNNRLILVLLWWSKVKIGCPLNSHSIAMTRCENWIVENFLQVLTIVFSTLFSIVRWWRFLGVFEVDEFVCFTWMWDVNVVRMGTKLLKVGDSINLLYLMNEGERILCWSWEMQTSWFNYCTWF
jgi:hypothetical protein